MRLVILTLTLMYAGLANAEVVGRSSGVSLGPDGVSVSVPGTGQLPELTYQGGIVGFNFSLTGSRPGEAAAAGPGPVRVLPSAPVSSNLDDSNTFFKGIGGPLPVEPQRRPRQVR